MNYDSRRWHVPRAFAIAALISAFVWAPIIYLAWP